MAMNFPNSPSDGQEIVQSNGIRYAWRSIGQKWVSLGLDDLGVQVKTLGVIWPFPVDITPTPAWVRCNGQEISRVDYALLFDFLGTYYGEGDGSTTFNVPDLRGLFVRDADPGALVDPDGASRDLGSIQNSANELHQHVSGVTNLVVASDGAHTHGLSTAQENGNDGGRVACCSRAPNRTNYWDFQGADHVHTVTDPGHTHPNEGGGDGRPRNINANHYIYTQSSMRGVLVSAL